MIVKSTPEIVITCFYISFVLKPQKNFVSRGYLNKLSNKENGMPIIYAVIVFLNQILAESVSSFFLFFFPKEQIRQTEQTINLLFTTSS